MFRNLFNGRYGMDELGFVLLLLSAILLFNGYTYVLGIVILVYALFRMQSKRPDKRYAELAAYIRVKDSVKRSFYSVSNRAGKAFYSLRGKIQNDRSRFLQRKEYVFTKCPNCKNTLRLPRHKGTLNISCPVCKNSFVKKT